MRRYLWGVAAAVIAALTPGMANATFSLTLLSAPGGYVGPGGATSGPIFPDLIVFEAGNLAFDQGRIVAVSTRDQFPTFASIGTTYQIKAATAPNLGGGGGYVPAGTYVIRIRNDEFTLPPGSTGTIGVIHTSIVPFAAQPGSPLITTTATSSTPGGNSATVNGSPMLTQMFEILTPKANGVYTLDQLVTINLPAGGSGQFSVTSYITAIPAPPALLLGVIGLPLFGLGLRRLRRERAVPSNVALAA
jgi:hypothetical protein